MMELQDVYTGLEEMMELQNCSDCTMDCPYYISGNYGTECALEVVMRELAIEMNEKKK